MDDGCILIADADITRRTAAAAILAAGGHSVIAEDAVHIRCALGRHRIKLLLIPLSLAEPRLMRQAKHRKIPVMFLLDSPANPKDVRRVYALGGCDYCECPPVAGELRTRVENQLAAVSGTLALEAASSDLYDFCMPVSHDLKAPFSAINQLVGLLSRELGDRCTENLREIIRVLDANTISVRKMIEALYAGTLRDTITPK